MSRTPRGGGSSALMNDGIIAFVATVGTPRQARNRYLGIGIAFLVALAFCQVGFNGYVDFDDDLYLGKNSRVRDGLTLHGVRWALTATAQANWHPLTWISHMVDFTLFGNAIGAHHGISLALHGLNTLLLFRVLRLTTGALLPSALAAALFGIHPLRVEAVAWAAERKELLATFFFLLALLAYRRYVARPVPARMVPVAAAFTLGLMSKPMIVTLPFALLLLDVWPLRRTRAGARPGALSTGRAMLLGEKAPLFLLAAASSLVTWFVQHSFGATRMLEHLPLPVRASNAVVAYARYLGKTLWPLDLAAVYPHPERSWPLVGVAAASLLLAGVTLLLVRARARLPAALIGWLWFLGTLVPVLGIVQVGWQSMADRYTYLPHLGLVTGVVWTGVQCGFGNRFRGLFGALAAIVLLALGMQTFRQVGTWRSGETLFLHALAATEENWLAAGNLGALLVRQRRNGEARGYLERALQRKPGHANLWYNLGGAYKGMRELDRAVAAYRQAIRLDPRDPDFHADLGLLALSLGRTDEAIAALSEALRLDPGREFVRKELAYAEGLRTASIR